MKNNQSKEVLKKGEMNNSLEEYKQAITSIHDGSVWNPNLEVWVHEFKKAS